MAASFWMKRWTKSPIDYCEKGALDEFVYEFHGVTDIQISYPKGNRSF